MDFIETDDFPSEIIVIESEEFQDLGFVTDLDELQVFVVDPCGRLAFIVVPPWRFIVLFQCYFKLKYFLPVPLNTRMSKQL